MSEARPQDTVTLTTAADGVSQSGKEQKPVELALRLMPVGNSDQPVFANYAALNVAPGVVFIDFGFIEPAVVAALPQVARQGGKLPETINGRLAVRVALTYDTVQQLKRQLDQLAGSRAGRKESPGSKG